MMGSTIELRAKEFIEAQTPETFEALEQAVAELLNDAEQKQRYRDLAKSYEVEGELEVDDDAIVSLGDDPGAYVQVWIWVPDPEWEVE